MAMFARNLLDARMDMRSVFLDQTDWRGGSITPLNADMGTRRYLRVEKNNRTAVLLESLPDGHPDASPGHRLDDWLQVNKLLASHGLSVPAIYADDLPAGYMLLEDWGDVTFTSALDAGHDALALYKLGIEAAKVLNNISIPTHFSVPDFFASHLPKTARRLVDWFVPLVRNQGNENGLAEEFEKVIAAIQKQIEVLAGPPALCFTHTDFHPGNLMLLDRAGVKACGILDFQNPMRAPVPYDFINLLYDARRAPAENIVTACRDVYCDKMTPAEKEAFDLWGVYTAMLFHARVTGQFLKAGLMGHNFYMQFLPVVAGHLAQDVKHPVLKPLADFLASHKISLDVPASIDLDKLRGLIRPDAV